MNWYGNSALIIAVSAYFEWFAVAAWGVALARLVLRRMSWREAALLLTFVGCVALEFVQFRGLSLDGELRRSLARYFGPFGAFLWIWLAWALHALWTLRRRAWRRAARACVVAFLGFVFIEKNVLFFVDQHEHGPAFDAYVAGALVASTVLEDWQACGGLARRPCMLYSPYEYLTADLPAVFDSWGTAAWWVRGQSEGPCLGKYPYPPDYVFVNDYEGCRGAKGVRPEDYEKMVEVEGTAHRWLLLRRVSK